MAHMGVSPNVAWRVCSLLFAMTLGSYIAHFLPASLAAYRATSQTAPLGFRLGSVVGALCVLLLLLLLLCAAGFVPTSVYLGALLFSLYAAGISFVRVFLSFARNAPG